MGKVTLAPEPESPAVQRWVMETLSQALRSTLALRAGGDGARLDEAARAIEARAEWWHAHTAGYNNQVALEIIAAGLAALLADAHDAWGGPLPGSA